jgi:hypothetical protein
MGWTPGYNFGTLNAVRIRWAAAVRAGVDFVATDQYEAFATARASLILDSSADLRRLP